EPVLELAAEWIPSMPNLRAVVFEIREEAVQRIGLDSIARLLERLHALWILRRAGREDAQLIAKVKAVQAGPNTVELPNESAAVGLQAWETLLGSLVTGHVTPSATADPIFVDPGVNVLRTLVSEARASSLSQGLAHSMTLFIVTLGPEAVRRWVDEYMRNCPPEFFVSAECDAFAHFLKRRLPDIPYLSEVLHFEHALIRATLFSETNEVSFEHDPTALLECLASGQLPRGIRQQSTSLVICPE